jgi:hypothetical protein
MTYDPVQNRYWDVDVNGRLSYFDPTNGYAQTQVKTFPNSLTGLAYLSGPAFFAGEGVIAGSVYNLQFSSGNPFGYYAYMGNGWIYHFDMGYEYVSPGTGPEVYLWDMSSGHWWYTNSGTFPYLYDFSFHAWLYYFPDTHNAGHYTTNPRYFVNMTTSQIFTM